MFCIVVLAAENGELCSGLKGFTIEYGRETREETWRPSAGPVQRPPPSRFSIHYDDMNVFDIPIRLL